MFKHSAITFLFLILTGLAQVGVASTWSGQGSWTSSNCPTQISWTTTRKPDAVTVLRVLDSQYCTPRLQEFKGPVWIVPNGTTLADLGLSVTFTNSSGTIGPSLAQHYVIGGTVGSEWGAGGGKPSPWVLNPTAGYFPNDWTVQIIFNVIENNTSFEVPMLVIVGNPAQGSSISCDVSAHSSPVTAPLQAKVGDAVSSLGLSLEGTNYGYSQVSGFLTEDGSPSGFNCEEFEASHHNQVSAPQVTVTGNLNTVGTFDFTAWAVAWIPPSLGLWGVEIRTAGFTVDVSPDPRIEVSGNQGAISHNGLLDFGTHDALALPAAWDDLYIANSGLGDLTVTSLTLNGGGSAAFELDTTQLSHNVTQGTNTLLRLRFVGGSTGSHTAWLEIGHSDPTAPNPYRVELRGVMTTAPVMQLNDADGPITHNSAAGAARTFSGDVSYMPATHVAVITVRNQGSGVLQLGAPVLAGTDAAQFMLDTASLSLALSPGAQTSFSVYFNAGTIGQKHASVQLGHNDSTQPVPFSFQLEGMATSNATITWLTDAILPDAIENTNYAPVVLQALGGIAPHRFNLTSGTLPAGMSLATDGTLAGTPTQQGDYLFTVQAWDASNAGGITRMFSLHVQDDYRLSAGGNGGGGGGCTSGDNGAFIALPLLLLVAFVALYRRRRA